MLMSHGFGQILSDNTFCPFFILVLLLNEHLVFKEATMDRLSTNQSLTLLVRL